MRIVIQRVKSASVTIDQEITAQIAKGLLLLVCFEHHDSHEVLQKAVTKIVNLRIFPDQNDKMNCNVIDAQGELLCVSQFTLSWKGDGGNRPSFSGSMNPDQAAKWYLKLCDLLNSKIPTRRGVFAASMQISLINDGPVTFCLDI